jgi:Trypsin-like peptidase domain
VRVTATFSYREQEDPKLTSGFRESPSDPAATAQGSPVQTLTWTSAGTGFLIDSDGHIATANHIVSPLLNQQGAEKRLKAEGKVLGPGSFQRATITVILGDSEYKAARVYRKNDRLDIAILAVGGSTSRLRVP